MSSQAKTGEAVAAAAGRTVARVETFVVEAGWRNFLIVKVTTSDGIVGWGDGTLGWKEFAVEAMVKEFGERYLIGRDPFRIEDLWFKGAWGDTAIYAILDREWSAEGATRRTGALKAGSHTPARARE